MAVLFEFLGAQLMIIAISKYNIGGMFRSINGTHNIREAISMTDSPYPVHADPHGRHDRKDEPSRSSLFGIDPIYAWSAVAGLVVALLLIGLGVLMHTHALH